MNLPAKQYINYFMAFLLFTAFLDTAISSYVLWFALPRGLGLHYLVGEYYFAWEDDACGLFGMGPTGNAWTVFEWPRYMWLEFHSWISVALVIIILIHLLLHWRWIIETTKQAKSYIRRGLKAIAERYATALILFVLFLFQVFCGCIIWLILPRGEGDYNYMIAGVGRTFWGLQRNVWSDIHAWVAVAIVAIIIIHVIMHWRWIVKMTLGEKTNDGRILKKPALRKITGTDGVIDSGELIESKPPKKGSIIAADNKRLSYLSRAGMFFGLFGAISFTVFTANFMLDWVGRYSLFLVMLPAPFITLFLAWKKPFIGAVLLIILGLVAVILDINFTIGVAGYVSGLGLGYTLFFITFPLLTSGILILLSERKLHKTKAVYS